MWISNNNKFENHSPAKCKPHLAGFIYNKKAIKIKNKKKSNKTNT